MSSRRAYTPYHPRWQRPQIPTYWWLKRWAYLSFILREISSLFVAWFIVYLFLLIQAVSQGQASYLQFLDWSGHPVVLIVNFVSLLFTGFHAITWFKLAPQAIVVRVGGWRVPGVWIAASNYMAWAVASGIVAWLLLRS